MGVKLSGIIFATSLAVGVVLRVFMLLFTVNPVSGFIEHEYLTSAVLMMIFMIVAAALIFVSAYCGKIKNPFDRYMPLIGAIVNIVLAVAIFYEVFISKLLEYAAGMQKLMHICLGVVSVACVSCREYSWSTVQCFNLQACIVGKAIYIILVVYVARFYECISLERIGCLGNIVVAAYVTEREYLYPTAQNIPYLF